jgi:hypothetical protein
MERTFQKRASPFPSEQTANIPQRKSTQAAATVGLVPVLGPGGNHPAAGRRKRCTLARPQPGLAMLVLGWGRYQVTHEMGGDSRHLLCDAFSG